MDRNFTDAEYAGSNVSQLMNGSFRLTNPLIKGYSSMWDSYLGNYTSFESQYLSAINGLLPPHNGANSTSQCRNYNLDYQLEPGFFNASLGYANEVYAWAYDAGVALGLATCLAPGARGADLYQAILRTSFIGLSGNVTFGENGNRDPDSLPWTIFQYGNGLPRRVGRWDPTMQAYTLNRDKLIFRSGSSSFPLAVTPPVENFNRLPLWARGLVYAELGILNAVLLACASWLVWNWNSKVVINAQGSLLVLLVLGLAVASWALLPLTVQDDEPWMSANNACMATPALFSVGFELALAALMGKMQRIRVLFHNPKLRMRVASTAHTMRLVGIFMVMELAFVIVWISVAPLTWQRVTVFQDVNGFVVESRGWCTGGPDTIDFTAIVFVLYAVSLVASVVVARTIQDAPAEFQESRFVAYSVVSLTQLYIVAVPTVAAVYASPLGSFIIISSLVFFSVLMIAFFMFGPKMYVLTTGRELWASTSGQLAQQGALSVPDAAGRARSVMHSERVASSRG
jgi:hypothetical protein